MSREAENIAGGMHLAAGLLAAGLFNGMNRARQAAADAVEAEDDRRLQGWLAHYQERAEDAEAEASALKAELSRIRQELVASRATVAALEEDVADLDRCNDVLRAQLKRLGLAPAA